jgi:hypothetical protein
MLPAHHSLRRLALPFGLSVGVHVLLLGLAVLFALAIHPSDRVSFEEGTGSFLLRLLAAEAPPAQPPRKPRPAPPEEEDWPIDVGARLVKPPSQADANPTPAVDPQPSTGTPGSASQTESGAAIGGTAPALPCVAPAARRVVYLVDRSISMGPSGALATARHEVAASLRALPPEVLFQVVPYNRLGEPLEMDGRRQLLPAEPATVALALRLLDEVLPEGATDHARGLRSALLLRPDVVFLLTDAGDLAPGDVPALVRLLGQGGAVLHVVELARGAADRGEGPLALLARGSGGSYRRVWPAR